LQQTGFKAVPSSILNAFNPSILYEWFYHYSPYHHESSSSAECAPAIWFIGELFVCSGSQLLNLFRAKQWRRL
jgi:hypothetical protein